MTTKPTGGPAFPAMLPRAWMVSAEDPAIMEQLPPQFSNGMTLRDWFAGMALQGLISGCLSGNNSGFTVQGNVTAAYEYADAMIEESGK